MKTKLRISVVAALIVSAASISWLAATRAQDAPNNAPAATRVGDDEAGRLPPGYTVVVTKAQRSRIYAIQDSYQKQLEDLKKQIEQIEGKRDAEIASLLNQEQKTIISYVLKLRESERKQEPASASGGGGN